MDRDVLPEGFELHWYKVQSLLGRGAFGVTYLALDQNLDQLVAIKEYFPNEFSSRVTGHTVHPITGEHAKMYEWGLDRFIKEARTLAKFKHHNIVRVFSVFEQNNTAYMVMEYERGQELARLYKSEGPLSEEKLLSIYLPISLGLKLVHEAGFIHRDIKPSNIYIRHSDGSPVLIDFGSARNVAGSQTQTLTSLVTQGYAPFEQFNEGEEKQGPWTDIYALGASLYYGVTGKLPIDSLSRGSSLLSTGVDSYQPVATLAAGEYSARFLKAIDAALMFHGHERPQSVTEWATMLGGEKLGVELHDGSLPAGDGDATVIVPRSPTGRPSPIYDGQNSSAQQTTILDTANQPKLPWRGRSYIGLGVIVLSVIVVLALTQRVITQDLAPTTKEQIAGQVNVLLARANEASNNGDLLEPPQQNAIYYYQQVLKLDLKNQPALDAIERIVRLYADGIRSDIAAGYVEEVSKKIKILQTVMVNSTIVAELQREVELVATQQQNVAHWLQQAREYMAEGKRAEPEERNALTNYRRVLAIAPDNQEAQDGMDKISQYYMSRAQGNLRNGNLSKVARDLKLVESIDPRSPSLLALDREFHELQQQQKGVSTLLRKARLVFDTGDLIQPSNRNALYFYNQVLKQDPNNVAARQGVDQIAKRLKSIFNGHMSNEKYDAAESVLKSVEIALPKSKVAMELRTTFTQNKGIPKSDIVVINKLIGDFKHRFEARDVKALSDISVFRPGVTTFLYDFFDNYPSFQLNVTNLKFIGKKRSGSANVMISELINKKGSKVQPGEWSRFTIVAQRNNEGQWKIYWGEAGQE